MAVIPWTSRTKKTVLVRPLKEVTILIVISDSKLTFRHHIRSLIGFACRCSDRDPLNIKQTKNTTPARLLKDMTILGVISYSKLTFKQHIRSVIAFACCCSGCDPLSFEQTKNAIHTRLPRDDFLYERKLTETHATSPHSPVYEGNKNTQET